MPGAYWVGIDGYSDGTVEQVGTEQDWANGSPVYYAWFEVYPRFAYKIVNFPVTPGDTMAAEVKYLGNRTYKLTMTNPCLCLQPYAMIAHRVARPWCLRITGAV
jgi:peptidase A4-like protein